MHVLLYKQGGIQRILAEKKYNDSIENSFGIDPKIKPDDIIFKIEDGQINAYYEEKEK